MEADGPDIRHAVVDGHRVGLLACVGRVPPQAAGCRRLAGWEGFLHGHRRAVEAQRDGDGPGGDTLRPPKAGGDAGGHLLGGGPDGLGRTFQGAARGRAPVISRHVLLTAAHVVLRIAQGNPEAERRGRPFHQARVQLQGHNRRAIAHTDRPIGPPLDVEGPAQREVPHRPRLVPLVEDAIDRHLLPVTVRDRHQIALQEESRRLIRQLQGRHLSLLEGGVGAHLRIDSSAKRPSEFLRWLCRRLVARDGKLMHCTHDASVVSL